MSRRLPPLTALRAFEAAARHLSFTKAAKELHVTQAAISHQIKALEEWLCMPLFRRQNRTLLLTDAAQAYLPFVREAFDKLVEGTQRLVKQDKSGTLTVSVLSSFAVKWLVPRLGRFADLHPDIDVRVSASDHVVDFASEDVDVAIRYGRGNWPGVTAEMLFAEDVFLVCSPKLLEGPRPLRTLDDLRHHTLLHEQTPIGWPAWMAKAGLDHHPKRRSLTFSHSNMVIQAAIDGLGVALGRSAMVGDDLAAGRLVSPFDITLHAEFAYYIVYPPAHADRPKIVAFSDWLKSEAGRDQRALPAPVKAA